MHNQEWLNMNVLQRIENLGTPLFVDVGADSLYLDYSLPKLANSNMHYTKDYCAVDILRKQTNRMAYTQTPGLYSVGTVYTSIKADKINFNRLKSMWSSQIRSIVQYKQYFVLDSGGYQVSMGYIPLSHVPRFVREYYEFVVELAQEKYVTTLTDSYLTFAFHLDLLNDYKEEEFYKYNKQTIAEIFADDKYSLGLRDNLVMVFQMLGHKKVRRIWSQLFSEYDIWNKFDTYSIGGLVAFGQPLVRKHTAALYLYFISYLFKLIKEHSQNKKQVHFHLLGVATPNVIPIYIALPIIASKLLGLDVKITYDSSLFKRTIIYRKAFIWNNNGLNVYSLKTNDLSPQIINLLKQKVAEILTEALCLPTTKEQIDFTECDFTTDTKCYATLHLLLMYDAYQKYKDALENDIVPQLESTVDWKNFSYREAARVADIIASAYERYYPIAANSAIRYSERLKRNLTTYLIRLANDELADYEKVLDAIIPNIFKELDN